METQDILIKLVNRNQSEFIDYFEDNILEGSHKWCLF